MVKNIEGWEQFENKRQEVYRDAKKSEMKTFSHEAWMKTEREHQELSITKNQHKNILKANGLNTKKRLNVNLDFLQGVKSILGIEVGNK